MAWITPKTNWVSTDFVNVADFNRITGNLEYLRKKLSEIRTISSLPGVQHITGKPSASQLNKIEIALEEINEVTYNFDIGSAKTYVANGHPFDYKELNRIESATLKIHDVYMNQLELSRHFAFTLGGTRMFDVPRSNLRADANVLGHRLSFRLGTGKGVYC